MPRTAESIQTEITALDAAIAKIVGGAQSYSISGQNVMQARLEVLYARRDQLQAELDSVNGDTVMFPEASVSGLGLADPIDEET